MLLLSRISETGSFHVALPVVPDVQLLLVHLNHWLFVNISARFEDVDGMPRMGGAMVLDVLLPIVPDEPQLVVPMQ